MSEVALDFTAYRELRLAAEAAEALILRLRERAFLLLDPSAEQSRLAFAELIAELETAPEIDQLRAALGRADPLPPPIQIS